MEKTVHANLFAGIVTVALLVIFALGGVARVFPEWAGVAHKAILFVVFIAWIGLLVERFYLAYKVKKLIQEMEKEKLRAHEKGHEQGSREMLEVSG